MSVLLGLSIDDAPFLGRTQVLCNLLEHGKVFVVRASGELAEGNGRVPNVRTTCDVCVQKFAEQGAVGEPMFGGECGVLGSVFGRARVLVDGGDGIGRKGSDLLRWMW